MLLKATGGIFFPIHAHELPYVTISKLRKSRLLFSFLKILDGAWSISWQILDWVGFCPRTEPVRRNSKLFAFVILLRAIYGAHSGSWLCQGFPDKVAWGFLGNKQTKSAGNCAQVFSSSVQKWHVSGDDRQAYHVHYLLTFRWCTKKYGKYLLTHSKTFFLICCLHLLKHEVCLHYRTKNGALCLV